MTSTSRRSAVPLAVPSAEPNDYYTIEQAARLLNVHRVTIWRWISSGRLQAHKVGPRSTRIRREDLDQAISALAPRVGRSAHGNEHVVQFYEADSFLLDSLGEFAAEGLGSGEAVIVVATASHRHELEQRLAAMGLSALTDPASGQYIALDAAETLEQFIVDGAPDADRFNQVIGTLVSCAAQNRPVRVFGEMVALLWAQGRTASALRLEALWNDLRKSWPFSLFCAYPAELFDGAELTVPHRVVCSAHGRVIPAEAYATLPSADERLRAIAHLQQKARSLEAEIAERKRIEEQLRRREAELTDFIENAAEALHWVSPDGVILWANRAELDMLGYTREEYIGHHIAEFHADPAIINDILARLTAGEDLYGYEARLRAKDGSTKYVLINSSAYRDGEKFVHTRCFTRDITERKELEIQQREFIALAAHELKTPLTSLKGFAQLMRRHRSYNEASVERIVQQSNRLDHLVTQLLDASRVENGRLDLGPTRLDLIGLARDCLKGAEALSEQHCFRLVAPSAPIDGDWDPERLEQVFENLLGNAVKYSPAGGEITVSIQDHGDHAQVCVHDAGVGIAPSLVSRVFDRFFRADGVVHSSDGLGLGLYITRSLVEAHGGTIWAESDGEGKGSRFLFTLPLASTIISAR